MKRKQLLKIGVDVDDVLYLCNQHAIDLLSRERDIGDLDIYDIQSWGESGSKSILDERLAYFSKPEFVLSQPLIPGAQDFIARLCQRAEVFFVTAVGKNCMNERASRLVKDFPQVPERNIIIGSRKDRISLDVLLDDGAHNILGTSAKYPVLFRRPWNNNLTGLLAVNSYDDFLRLVDQIDGKGEVFSGFRRSGVVCLVGPSGSGKSDLAKTLVQDYGFGRPVTTTTRQRRSESENYNFISRKEFQNAQDRGQFLEFTVYGGQYYGCRAEDVKKVLDSGKNAVMPIDICGAIAVKNAFPDRCIIVFTDRSRRAVLRGILNMNCPEDEKVLRILSLDSEFGNREICDFEVNMDQGPESCAKEIASFL